MKKGFEWKKYDINILLFYFLCVFFNTFYGKGFLQ